MCLKWQKDTKKKSCKYPYHRGSCKNVCKCLPIVNFRIQIQLSKKKTTEKDLFLFFKDPKIKECWPCQWKWNSFEATFMHTLLTPIFAIGLDSFPLLFYERLAYYNNEENLNNLREYIIYYDLPSKFNLLHVVLGVPTGHA